VVVFAVFDVHTVVVFAAFDAPVVRQDSSD